MVPQLGGEPDRHGRARRHGSAVPARRGPRRCGDHLIPEDGLQAGADGVIRCWWCGEDPLYVAYHDTEWGRPKSTDRRLFEDLCLDGFQAGLSWITILRKREAFRKAFSNFDLEAVAAYGPQDVERLMGDAGIVRNRAKIEATIRNARAALALVEERGSLSAHVWSFAPPPAAPTWPLPATAPAGDALSKDLKRRGWTFVGPTIIYAFMQAVGMVNDHLPGCVVREEAEAERAAFQPPAPAGEPA